MPRRHGRHELLCSLGKDAVKTDIQGLSITETNAHDAPGAGYPNRAVRRCE